MNLELSEIEVEFLKRAVENQPVKGAQLSEVVISLMKKLAGPPPPKPE